MEDANDSIVAQEINDNIFHNVPNLQVNKKGLNNFSSQAKILDYYKPKPSLGKAGGEVQIRSKTKNETQSILEDVCNDFENIDVTPLKNGPTIKIVNHSTPINVVQADSEETGQIAFNAVGNLIQGNECQLAGEFDSRESNPINCQDVYVVDPTDLEKLCSLPVQKSSEGMSVFNLTLSPVSCTVPTTSSSDHIVLVQTDDRVISKKIFNNISHHVSVESDCNTTASSFTVSDNVPILKNSDGQNIEFGEYEISDEFYIDEDSECLNNEDATEDTLQTSAESESYDISESDGSVPKSALAEIKQGAEENMHISPCLRNTKARRISAKMKKQWAREIAASGHLICPMPGCHQKYVTVANFQTHYKWCTGKKTLQHCPHCDSLIFTGVEAVLHHMMVEHPEKVDEYKEKCASETVSLVDETENVTTTGRKCKVKMVKKRSFSKENSLARKNNSKKELKSMEDTMNQNFSEFKKCVRFNDIVEKINAVTEKGVNTVELQHSRRLPRILRHKKRLQFYENEVVEQPNCFEESEENVDCPSDVVDEKPPRRITTKSRIVLNTQGYKRFNEYLKLTRDWASERKTYSRSKSSDFSGLNSSSEASFLMGEVQDTYQLNESSEPAGISLSSQDEEYTKSELNVMESSLIGSSIKRVAERAVEISGSKPVAKGKSLSDVPVVPAVKDEVKCVIPMQANMEEKVKYKSALTPEPFTEVNYGHLIFAQPSKISTKERATCYDNVDNKTFIDSIKTEKIDQKIMSKKSLQEQKLRRSKKALLHSNLDFDNLLKNYVNHTQPKKKRGRPPKIVQPSTSAEISPLNIIKHCKEDGVKLPTDVKVKSVKKRRGRPPKMITTPAAEVHVVKKEKEVSKKTVPHNPIVFNQSINLNSHSDNDKASVENFQMLPLDIQEASKEEEAPSSSADILNSFPGMPNASSLCSKTMQVNTMHEDSVSQKLPLTAESNSSKQLTHPECDIPRNSTRPYTVPKLETLAAIVLKNSAPSSAIVGKDDMVALNNSDSIQNSVPNDKILMRKNSLEPADKNFSKNQNSVQANKSSETIVTDTVVCENGGLTELQKIIYDIINKIEASDKPAVQNSDLVKNKSALSDQPLNTFCNKLLQQVSIKNLHNNLDDSVASSVSSVSELSSTSIHSPNTSTNVSQDGVTNSNTLVADNLISKAVSHKKRRRPLKGLTTITTSSEVSDSPAAELNESVTKRKRGRPRKTVCTSESRENRTDSPLSHSSNDSSVLTCSEVQDSQTDTNKQGHSESLSSNDIQNVESNTSSVLSKDIDIPVSDPGLETCPETTENAPEVPPSVPTVDNVRKSSRIRKPKYDDDSLFLEPKKVLRVNRPETTDQTVAKTGKRGRPKKISMNSDPDAASSPPSKVIKLSNAATLNKGIKTSESDASLCERDGLSDSRKKGSRKGRPRKCVRYADLNSGIESHESLDDIGTSDIQSASSAGNAVAENGLIGQCSVNCISKDLKAETGESKDKNCSCSENKTQSSVDGQLVSLPTNDISQLKENVSTSSTDKSVKLYKKKLKHNFIQKYKSKVIGRKNKSKLHKMHYNSSSRKKKLHHEAASPECPSAVPASDSKKHSDHQDESASHLPDDAIQTPTSRKTRLAAIKARRLLGSMLHSDGKSSLNVKEDKSDTAFVPEEGLESEDDDVEHLKCDIEKEFSKYKEHVECPEMVKPIASKSIVDGWIQELERDGKIVCQTQGCSKSLGTVPGMIYHYEVACPKKFYSWRCRFCEMKFKPNTSLLLRHMEKIHFPPEKSLAAALPTKTREKNSTNYGDFLSHVKNFFEKKKGTELMAALKPKVSLWKKLDPCEEFIPSSKTSLTMKIESVSSEKGSSSWFNLPYFQSSFGKTDSNHILLYAGGHVTCSAWCPTPHENKVTQYVCLATSNKFTNCLNSPTEVENEKGLIQLWNVGVLDDSKLNQPPVLDLAIVHNHGQVRAMAWCPHGCYEHPSDPVNVPGEFFPRLGLLAIACSDSAIRIYSVPHPQYLKSPSENLPFYAVEPAILLKSRRGETCLVTKPSLCTSVCWQRTDEACIIMGGFSNGLVSLWDISSCNGVEKCSINPYLTFQAHTAAVTSVCFAPFSSQQYAATGSLSKSLKIWNLEDTSYPVQEHKKGCVKSIQWPVLWSGLILSFDDGLNTKGSVYKDFGSMRYLRNISNNVNTCEWASSISEWLNACIVGDAFGSVTLSTLRRINSSHNAHQRYVTSYPIIHTEIVPMDESDDSTCQTIEESPTTTMAQLTQPSSEVSTTETDQSNSTFDEKCVPSANGAVTLEDSPTLSNALCNSTSDVSCDCPNYLHTLGHSSTEANDSAAAFQPTLCLHMDASCKCICDDANCICSVSKIVNGIVSSVNSTLTSTTKLDNSNTCDAVDLGASSVPPSERSLCCESQNCTEDHLCSWEAVSKRYRLKFITNDMANIKKEMPNLYHAGGKSSVSSCYHGFHLTSIDYTQWNPNYGSHSWLFVVNQPGIVQILNAGGLEQRTQPSPQ